MRLSVVVPGYKEPLMQRTIDSLLAVSELGGDLEVIAVLDGPWMKGTIREDRRVSVIQFTENRGMRAAINAGVEAARGKFVMKVDAHCSFAPGFDKVMSENCDDNWLVVPRRYSLDDVMWMPNRKKPPRDYHYLPYPDDCPMSPLYWAGRLGPDVDDTMTLQGSCWVANRREYLKRINRLDDNPGTYGTFAGDQLELGLKYWLNDGEVKVCKKTWYAHLWKKPRHYETGEYGMKPGRYKTGWAWATRHWINNEEPGVVKPFSWLVEKFWPVPGWPEDRNLWRLS